MSEHPIATAQQHAHELAVLELISHPTVTEAYRRVAAHWLDLAEPSDAMRECFDWAFREIMFSAAIWSSNQDPLRPKVTCITRLAHAVQGREIPGSRWGIDNPDSIYRVIPISGDERCRINGRVGANRMTENHFTLWDEKMGTVDVLNGRTMALEADGAFTITVDSSPANGRPNHVQSAPEAHEFYIRDVMLDWSLDDPNHFTIERLGSEPTTPPRTIDEQAQLTADFMLHYADFTRRMSRGTYRMPANHFSLAWSADHTGALRNQGKLHRWMRQIGHDGRLLKSASNRWRFLVWHNVSASTNEAVVMVASLDEPPLRLLLGQDVLNATREKLKAMNESIDQWESVTLDVNFPT